ncbi:hypothetical protein [Rhizobium giardinii]|uniref:hypothetical protein n=1 Tax=Rhizobium giardinii TaxID=56731 RepID=UPI003D6FB9AE
MGKTGIQATGDRVFETGSRKHGGLKVSRLFVQPPSKAHCPALNYSPRKASNEIWVMGCVAAIAKGDKI